MTSHWLPSQPLEAAAPAVEAPPQGGRFELTFQRHGARTAIGRQFVSYPFHLTRPFALDADIPSLLTVYQQSSSGGLYRAENLTCRYEVGQEAAAHVTTQAATIIHDCQGQTVNQTIDVGLQEGAFLALTPDPMILFPGASCTNRLQARLAPRTVLLLADSFALHDPLAKSRPFDRFASDVVISDALGRMLVRDSFHLIGETLNGAASPLGNWPIFASFLLLGDPRRLPIREELVSVTRSDRAIAGVTSLPNAAGLGIRCLAADAVALRRVGELIFSTCVRAALGCPPAPRRK